ncbi:MAG: hypothetical protein H0T42_06605 [Deltaproteobacteria bacterium]|nr:hypothetical protein [Deltaproteobacteria bacterium]
MRGRVLDAIADELSERASQPLRSELEQLVFVVLQMRQLAEDQIAELGQIEQRWRDFDNRLFHASPEDRRQVLADYLSETVADSRNRRADLAAIDRYLDYDAMRERHQVARHRVLVILELAVTFIGNAVGPAMFLAGDRAATAREIFHDGRITEFLHAVGETGGRWQLRAAALDGLLRCVEVARERDVPWLTQLAAHHLGLAVRCATNLEEPAWVQGRALALVLALSFDLGIDLVARRLMEPAADTEEHVGVARRDFLVRRTCVDLLAAARDDRSVEVLRQTRRDPSTHVRQGLAVAFAQRGQLTELRSLAGLDPGEPERSSQVRASAVEAAFDAAITPEGVTTALQLAVDVLAIDAAALPLTVACEESAGIVARAMPPAAVTERLLTELLRLSSRGDRSAAIREIAAAAAERVALSLSEEARAWWQLLAAVTEQIPVGGSQTLALEDFPNLPPLPADPEFLGRILATLSRSDYPLFATRTGGRLQLWRGDRFRRRLWRLLHEVGRPAPNKRQAYRHTLGRVMRGQLRAPPGGLDEATATTVPGERLFLAEEGGWARHLPTVDDVLDLPLWSREPVRIFSSYGTTTMQPPAGVWRRLRNRFVVSRRYARLAALRTRSLRGTEHHDRQRFTDEVRGLGIELTFARHTYPNQSASVPDALAALIPVAPVEPPRSGAALALGAFPFGLGETRDWLEREGQYFSSLQGNGQLALALFLLAFAIMFFIGAYRKRAQISTARKRIPMTIGGWGTRGKSGTERLKAAVFHGLGYEVAVKTTGCEAMLIHSISDEAPHEIFLFRSYDKATIWEQRDVLETAADLGSEVFLWECMALQPEFVELLQRDWMRDDVVTLTNAFTDHEDVQGPSGADVAECISTFIPRDSTLLTSEVNFLPLFAERSRARGTTLHVTTPRSADLIADDLLALFPYNEHPRNIALVADLAEELGIDRHLAIITMAEHVVPDLGVLKAYPAARIRGRTVQFFNGMSANERTGFVHNWGRTGLGSKDVEDPRTAVVTVVNNRWDRVARSEVFGRIVVEDAPADAHVLIGTNLRGLRRYIGEALRRYLETIDVAIPEDLKADDGAARAAQRLATVLARLRVPVPSAQAILSRLELYAAGADLAIDPAQHAELERIARELCAPAADASIEVAHVRDEVAAKLGGLERMLVDIASTGDEPEVLSPAEPTDVVAHAVRQVTRIVVHARLRGRLSAVLSDRTATDGLARIASFNDAVRAVYRALFEDQLVVVNDPGETGDQIIDRCAQAVPPGTSVSVMGIQNIKGTGLDFVYRWLALDHTTGRLVRLASEDAAVRLGALRELELFADYGLVSAGVAAAYLDRFAERATDQEERMHARRARDHVRAVHVERKAALAIAERHGTWARISGAVEALLDPIDSIRRRRKAQRIFDDLITHRISHGRAAKEMRGIYDRQGGGWLTRRES